MKGIHLAVLEVLSLSIPPATAGSFSLSRQLLQLHSRDLGEQRPANCLSRAEGLVAVITGDLTHRQSRLTSLGLGLMS